MNTKHTAFKPIALSLLVSGLMYSAATQRATASDLQIYKPPEGGQATVVLMLDTSGSMEECDLSGAEPVLPAIPSGTTPSYGRVICRSSVTSTITVFRKKQIEDKWMSTWWGGYWTYKDNWYKCAPNTTNLSESACNELLSSVPNTTGLSTRSSSGSTYYTAVNETKAENADRITRLKDALFAVLNRKDTEGKYVLGENVLMGLGHYSSPNTTGSGADNVTGRMIVPAKPLTPTHRTDLLQAIAGLKAQGGTPTAHAYAEAAAYLMGTTTGGGIYSGIANSDALTKDTDGTYKAPFQQAGVNAATCDGQGIYVLTDGTPNGSKDTTAAVTLMNTALNKKSLLASSPSLPVVDTADTRSFGSGIWPEIGHFSRLLRDKTQNPAQFRVLTAVVGFGSVFTGATVRTVNGKQYYDCSTITGTDAKNACNWGAKPLYSKVTGGTTTYATVDKNGNAPAGYSTDPISGGFGNGGFYPASKTEEVVQSILDFVSDIGGEIPPVPTGSIIIPQDTLAPDSLQRYAYVPALLTQPTDPVVIWGGNLKKYKVENGTVYGNLGTNELVFDDQGGFNPNTTDYWNSATVGDKGNVQTGGMFEKIPYKTTTSDTPRSVWVQKSGTTMTKVEATKASLDALGFGDYYSRKILNFMGYSVSGAENDPLPATIDTPVTPLRALGGVVHSTPQLLTYGANLDDDGQLTDTRDDYLLFGSMEGSLHLIDTGTGIEKFAFLPRAMVTRQPRALQEGTEGSIDGSTSRSKTGSPPMYYPAYGVDAPWAAYAEYKREGSKLEATKMYAYGGLRMGGAGFYGLDLTNKSSPTLMFALEGGGDFERLGQTWGKPVVTRIRYNNKPHLVVVISGGYDEKYEDSIFKSANATDVKGNAVYVVSAETANGATAGQLLLKIDSSNNSNMKHSIVGRVKTLDRDADGLTDHLYFADLGGQVFRTDINNAAVPAAGATQQATVTRVVRLANLTNPDGSLPRFYEAPTVTLHDEGDKRFALINVGSGDRSNPLYDNKDVNNPNRIYGIIDRDVARIDLYSASLTEADMNSQNILLGNLIESPEADDKAAMLGTPESLPTKEGWHYPLDAYGSATSRITGLKAFNEPAAIRNDLYLSVYNPIVVNPNANKCEAQVVGASELHRYCLPFGVCSAEQGSNNLQRFALGRGIQTVNIGPGETGDTRRIIYQKPTTDVKDEVTGTAVKQHSQYTAPPRLVPIRWYEKQPKITP